MIVARRTMLAGMLGAVAVRAEGAAFPDTTAWAALDKASGRLTGSGGDRRMPMCSTFKWLLAAAVLARVDRGAEALDRRVSFGRGDLLDYAPTVKAALGSGATASLSVGALCEAAVTLSDNSAANLLLPRVDGPAGLTRWLRAIGDPVTRLDYNEPQLNHVAPGAVHDTTTPAAMVRLLDRLLYGGILRVGSRRRLMTWMLNGKTGDKRLRAGVPADWRVGEKTGTFGGVPGERSASGDVGFLLPPGREPILVAAYTTGFDDRQPDADHWFAALAQQLSGRR